MPVLQSLIADRWVGSREGAALASAIDGATVYHAHADEIDFGEALSFARRTGGAALLALDFQQRAARLKALAAYLNERKEELYAISRHTGATRSDGWVDIEGGTGTLYAYASMGGNELPSGNVLHEGPPVVLGKKGQFAATHILVPRGGVAVHINAFNFPVWGLLEKFAPTFLAGMPCIAKPATATSYLTEALVRMMMGSGLLPAGSLQLVIGPTGDLLDRLDSSDVVTFTGSADTALKLRRNANLLARSIPFNAEADSLNAAILGPDVEPGRRGVRPVRQGSGARDDGQGRPEVHRDPARDRAAPAPRRDGRAAARSPRQGQRRRSGGRRRQDGRARLEGAAGRRRRAARAARRGQRDRVRRRRRLRAERRGRRQAAPSSRRRWCCAATGRRTTRSTTSRRSARCRR